MLQKPFFKFGFVLTLFSFFFLNSCGKELIPLPPITETSSNNFTYGKAVWHDLITDDIETIKDFYGELFGWTFEEVEDTKGYYHLIKLEGKLIGGVILSEVIKPENRGSRWLTYISVSDVETVYAKALAEGGTSVREPFENPTRGKLAVVRDFSGAVIVFINSKTGDPEEYDYEYNNWFWSELWTKNVENAYEYYQSTVGYNRKTLDLNGNNYDVLEMGGKPRAGIVTLPWEGPEPVWLPYIAVDDVKKYEEMIPTLGGKIVLSSNHIAGGSSVIFTDPFGAPLAVQKWPLNE